MTTETQLPVLEFSALPLSTPVEADKLADAANFMPAETTVVTFTDEELYAEIARLWAANKVNRYDLGEKLCQLKKQAKHGEWMVKVQQMGIPQRTVNSLMEYYREEFMRRNPPANPYDLGEKLWQLKQQAKHGEWMTKVQQMGIPQRTANSLMEDYREEYMRRNPPANPEEDFEGEAPHNDSAEEPVADVVADQEGHTASVDPSAQPIPVAPVPTQENAVKPASIRVKGSEGKAYFRPHITLTTGAEEKAWNHAIDVIIREDDDVNNESEAALFAVVAMAQEFERRQQQREIEAIGVGSPIAASSVELPTTKPGVFAPVTVAPAPILENLIKPVPVPVPSLPPTPRKPLFISDEDEEVR
jgi:hypothetical protein